MGRLTITAWLAAALAAAFSGLAQANAGRLHFVSGDVRIAKPDGTVRAAQKGDVVEQGDLLITGAYAVAQMRMIDDGLIAVRPDTQLRIDEYVYAGREDGSERGVIGLLRGGFRTLTGVIGRTNRNNYLVRTPNATIGIRGTDHEPLFIPAAAQGEIPVGQPGTYNKVNVGETFIEAGGQRVSVGPNQAAFASLLPGTAPVRLEQIPGFMRATPVPQSRDERHQPREAQASDQKRLAAGPQQPPGPGAQQPPGPGAQQPRGPGAQQQPGATGPRGPLAPLSVGGMQQQGGFLQPVFLQQTSGSSINLQQIGTNLSAAPADYLGAGADLAGSGASGSGLVIAGKNGAQILFGAGGLPALITSGNGFQYARAGVPLVDAGVATFTDSGTAVPVRWGVYAGGAVVDNQGPRATQFFQFMGAQGTPSTVVSTLSATYGGVGSVVASTKLVTEGGVVGGQVVGLNTSISINAGNLTGYQVSMVDGLGRSWKGCAFACSVGSLSLATFATSGVSLTAPVNPGSGGSSGQAQGGPVGPTGSAFLSSFNLKTGDGKSVTGAFTVK